MKNLYLLSALILGCLSCGCQAMDDSRQLGHNTINSMFPVPQERGNDYADENRVDKGHEEMMLQSRSGMSKSSENDKWWFDKIMSPEARSIERSLGVEYY
jgi:hypothetical protein